MPQYTLRCWRSTDQTIRAESAVIGAVLGATVGAILSATATLAWFSPSAHPAQRVALEPHGEEMSKSRRLEDTGNAKPGVLLNLLGLTPATHAQLETELAAWQIRKLPPVVKRKASKTILADVFVRLHQHMWRMGLLPLSKWGLGRDSQDLYQILPTLSYQYFHRRHSKLVPPEAMCLAFSSNGDMERNAVPNCAKEKYWSLEFRKTDQPKTFLRRAFSVERKERGKVLAGDLTRMTNTSIPDIVRNRFDLVFCHEVFEHVPRPFDAAQGLYHLVKPGGLVFFHVPFLTHRHGKSGKTVSGDAFGHYFQYSPAGSRQMFLDAGFEILSIESMGNGMTATGLLMGFGPDDFDPSELSSAIGSSQETHAPSIFSSSAVVARKPTGQENRRGRAH